MGVYAAMGGVGATVGLLLGGTLTDVLDRRWVFFVNIPIDLAVLAGSGTPKAPPRSTWADAHPGISDRMLADRLHEPAVAGLLTRSVSRRGPLSPG
ncbi:hypothetical protein [Streptomyces sp. NPDC090798]|uniref:hypothetical protein n=1 Tax=Streptomyces sp. NPDC090798 TaxID=3365968 RepID=UPI00380B41C9